MEFLKHIFHLQLVDHIIILMEIHVINHLSSFFENKDCITYLLLFLFEEVNNQLCVQESNDLWRLSR